MNAIAQPLALDDERETFTFEQLSDDAKERARQRYLESDPYDYDWWDCIYEDAITIAEMMGITIKTTEQKTMGGKSYQRPCLYFSGFWSQGDGACFTGDWHPFGNPGAVVREVRRYAPKDKTLHRLALALAKASRDSDHFGYVRTRITHSGNYYHSHSVSIETEIEMPDDYDDWPEFKQAAFKAIVGDAAERIESDVKDTLRAYMDWIYSRLNEEWDYMHEDAYVDEYLSDQDTFYDEDGDEI